MGTINLASAPTRTSQDARFGLAKGFSIDWVGRILKQLVTMQARFNHARDLEAMDERTLADVGISRGEALEEAARLRRF